jgi:hypothetical protein
MLSLLLITSQLAWAGSCFENSSKGRALATSSCGGIAVKFLFPTQYQDSMSSIRVYRQLGNQQFSPPPSADCTVAFHDLTPGETYKVWAVGDLDNGQQVTIDPVFVPTLTKDQEIRSKSGFLVGYVSATAVAVHVEDTRSSAQQSLVFLSGNNVLGTFTGNLALQELPESEKNVRVELRESNRVVDALDIPVGSMMTSPSTSRPSAGTKKFPGWATAILVIVPVGALVAGIGYVVRKRIQFRSRFLIEPSKLNSF